jgi:hypothetical protein
MERNRPRSGLVFVEWVDSHHRPGWTADEPEADLLVCKSVGWIVRRTKDVIVLAANVTAEDKQQRCGDMTIPQRCVRRIKTIRV